MAEIKPKYYTYQSKRTTNRGRPIDPDKWITGTDPINRQRYYAWLKHRAQARFRGEEYELTYDDFRELWSDDLFVERGRGVDNYCLGRWDQSSAWSLNNCYVCTRKDFLKRNQEFRRDRS